MVATGRGRRIARACALLAGALGIGLAGLAAPAHAGEGPGYGTGTNTDGGYGVKVSLRGNWSESLRVSVPGPPPVCWWSPVAAPDPSDPQGVYDWFRANLSEMGPSSAGGGRETMESVANYPEDFEDAIEAGEAGKSVTWYQLQWDRERFSGPDGGKKLAQAGCTTSKLLDYGSGATFDLPVTYAWYEGNPPEPQIDAETLAQYAYRVMDLVSPELNWNPRIDLLNSSTMVNLPTWLWVREPQAVETRTVTASVGAVSATVTARTDGLSVASPAGATTCTAAEARTAWAKGVAEADACVLRFTRGSYGYEGGFPVEARSAWTASWTSTTNQSGNLDPRTVLETTRIPVAQSETLVTEVG